MNSTQPANSLDGEKKQAPSTTLPFLKKRQFWLIVGAIHLLVIVPAVIYLVWKRPDSGEQALAKYHQALPTLKKEVENDPENYQLRNEYAFTLYVTQNDDEAINQYSTLVNLNPTDPVPSNNLGNLLRKRGSYDDAVESYKRSVEVNPNQINAYVNLAHLYIYDIKQPELGYDIFDQVITLNPDNMDLKVMLAKTYQQQNADQQAIAVYTDILEVDPDNVAAQNGLKVLGASTENE